MSKWNEYGFPDLSGVHFQTALQGLTCAVMERYKAIFGDEDYGVSDQIKDFYEDEKSYCHPIPEITKSIDNIFAYLHYYVLPDGSLFTLENAANYLKEDLIDLALRFDGEWPYPNSALKYEWCMQRYRFINLAWKTRPDAFVDAISILEESSGNGETLSDAVNNLEHIRNKEDFYMSFYIEQESHHSIYDPGNHYYAVDRYSCIPRKVRYGLHSPGLVCLEITPRMTTINGGGNIPEDALEFTKEGSDYVYKWEAYDFGLGLKFNTPQIFYSQYIPAGVEPGTDVELNGLFERLYSIATSASFPIPPVKPHQPGIRNSFTSIYRGFYSLLYCYADLRHSFEFYDEIKVE
jgi:hypothetical protein